MIEKIIGRSYIVNAEQVHANNIFLSIFCQPHATDNEQGALTPSKIGTCRRLKRIFKH